MLTRDTLNDFFKQKAARPLGFREIVFLLSLSPAEKRRLKKILREMVNDGEIVRTRKGLYGPSVEMNLVSGYFEAHRDGYGFVIPEKPGDRDIFIPARVVMGAMDNDRVVAKIESAHKREGRIIRILERAHAAVTGRFEAGRTGFYVIPRGRRAFPFDIYVSHRDKGAAKNGDTVIAEIINYPSGKRPPSARVVKVLKKPETPRDDIERIIDEFSLPRRFPRNVAEEAKELYRREHLSEDGGLKRKDLRRLNTVTIDGESAKDFDDAVSIEKNSGGYRLWVHIADVGYYVKPGTSIETEARKRGTSVYFPDRALPMLPKELSEDLCSLKPKTDRLAFTVEMEFDALGRRLVAKFYPSVIHSNERMTYTSVKKLLVDSDREEIDRYGYLLKDFAVMGELCNVLKRQRIDRGSLDFDLPEPEVLLDILGNPESIIKAERNFAHMIIEEFMIAANEAVAKYLEDLGMPCIYRVHEEPDSVKMENILNIFKSIGIIRDRRIKALDFPELLRRAEGTEGQEFVSHVILRSLKQARYSAVNAGHFGLASGAYAHFTSPIRRYPDLVVHRILKEVLAKKRLSDKKINELEAMLPDIAFHSSRTERHADAAERTALNAMRAWFMKDRVGEEFEGRVVSVTPYGLKIRLKDYYIEGFLHVSYMTDDFYEYDEKNMTLSGRHRRKRFAIGNELRVRIDKVDMEEREIILGV